MTWNRIAVMTVFGLAMALLASGTLQADDAAVAEKADEGDRSVSDRLQPADALSAGDAEPPRLPGPPFGFGPGRGNGLCPGMAMPGKGPGPMMGGPGRGGPPGLGGRRGGPPEGRGPMGMGPGFRARWPHHDWKSVEENDPEMYPLLKEDYELERQSRELALQYRRAPISQRAAIRRQLQEVVTQHFESRQRRRLLELKRLEEELKRLRDAIDRRNEAREEVVGRRVSELLGEDDIDF